MTVYLCSVCNKTHDNAKDAPCMQTFIISGAPAATFPLQTETIAKSRDRMRSSIIIVGTDGVGKTPIAKCLSLHYSNPYFKFQNEVSALKDVDNPGQSMLWFDYGMTQLMTQTGLRIVSDRGYPCEWVYATYFNRKTDLRLLEEIDEQHRDLNTIILWLYDSKIKTSAKYDPHISTHDIPEIQKLYQLYMTVETRCKYVSYDVDASAHCEFSWQRQAIDVPNIIELIDRKVAEEII